MPDNPARPKISRHEAELERNKRDNDIAAKNRIASHFWSKWKISTAKYPILASVTTASEFQQVVRDNPDLHIPPFLFSDYAQAEKHEREALALAKLPLSEIAPDPKKKLFKPNFGEEAHGPLYMDHDARYRKLVDSNPYIVKLREANPELKKVSSLTMRDDGSLFLNPELTKHFAEIGVSVDAFDLEETVREQFRQLHPESAKIYDANEKHRIYKDPTTDPALIKLNRSIDTKTDAELKKRSVTTPGANTPAPIDKDTLRQQIAEEELLGFAKAMPNKAAAYSLNDPAMKQAYLKSKEQQDYEAGHITPGLHPLSPGTTPFPTTPSAPVTTPFPVSTPAPQITPAVPSPSSYRRAMPQTGSVSNNRPQAKQQGKGPQGPARSVPGLPGGLPGFSPTQIGQFLTQQAVQEAKRRIIIIVLIGLLILLFIYLLLSVFFGKKDQGPGDGSTGTTPVYITKKVNKDAVPNPDDGKPGEEITYDITVSYDGKAQDIVINDPIPEGSEYVSSKPEAELIKEGDTVTAVKWSLAALTGTASSSAKPSTAPQGRTFPYDDVYKPMGFPPPQNNGDDMTDDVKERWKMIAPLVVKASEMTGVDVGVIGMWPWLENGITTYMDNCGDTEFDPNTVCGAWGGNWQVGYGNQPGNTIQYLKEAVEKMHPGESAKQIGDAVIESSKQQNKYPPNSARIPYAPITVPSSFPNRTIDDIVLSAQNGEEEARHLVGLLMKDDAIGIYIVARHFEDIIAGGPLAQTMYSWPPSEYYEPQKIINLIAGIYKAGFEGGTNGNVGPVKDYILNLTVRPKAGVTNTYITNQASVDVVGGSNKNSVAGNPNESFVYYCQGAPDWNQGGSTCIQNAGCGPTSLAMIMSTLGVKMTPLEVDEVFQRNDWRKGCEGASYFGPAVQSPWFANLGFTVSDNVAPNGQLDLGLIKEFLDHGYIIYAGADNYPCLGCVTKGVGVSHVTVIDDVDVPGNRIHVRDPNNCNFSTGEENSDDTRWLSVSEGLPTGTGDTIWNGAFPIKKD